MTTQTAEFPVQVHRRGQVSDQESDYVRERVLAALRHASEPVLFARARLTRLADPALERPAVAQANVDLSGRQIRCQVAHATMTEAVDALHDRLVTQLQRAARHWEAIRGSQPVEEPGEWRRARRPTQRPEYFPRPAEERRTLRHKTFTPSGATVEEAAFDMDLLDYDFHLFTELGSGQVSVLYRVEEGYRLAQVEPAPELVAQGSVPVTVSPLPPPELTEEQAVERLEQTQWPFVFFRDAASGRGRLLYHRYDGDYGLITPSD